ncbi:retrovirus-related pol polyprotein from transposon TNT 1-94 [Tanacetum coccineum]
MTGNQNLFSTYKAYNGGNIIFGSNLRGNIIGKGPICDNKCRVPFFEYDSEITKDGKVIGRESLNVTFDETPPSSKTSPFVDDDLDEEEAIKVTKKKSLENDIEDETLEIDDVVNIKESRNHPLKNVIGNLNQRTLRLVAQGYNQQEGIDYDETYASVARLESIRILLAYACDFDFKLFQIDIKSAFLNGFINEEASKRIPKPLILKQLSVSFDTLKVTMPLITGLDHQNTRNYIPIISNEFDQPLQSTLKLLEKRYFHEGRVVSHNFQNMNYLNAKFESIGFECLLKINEQIVPRFVLEFYSQLEFDYNSKGHFVAHFIIQNKSFPSLLKSSVISWGFLLKVIVRTLTSGHLTT